MRGRSQVGTSHSQEKVARICFHCVYHSEDHLKCILTQKRKSKFAQCSSWRLPVKVLTLIALMVFSMTLSACHPCVPPQVITVYVPAPCVAPTATSAPTLTTPLLSDNSTSKEIFEAYVVDLEAYKTYSRDLEAALAPYYACSPKAPQVGLPLK